MSEQIPADVQRALVRLSILVQGRRVALDACLQEFRSSLRQQQAWSESEILLARLEQITDDAELEERQVWSRLQRTVARHPAFKEGEGKHLLDRFKKQHSWELMLINVTEAVALLADAPHTSTNCSDILRLRGKIAVLLDSLRSYTSAYESIDDLQSLLAKAEAQPQIEEILQRISSFVANLLVQEQQEFELYLDSLNAHLKQICSSVQANRGLQTELDLSSDQLQKSIAGTVDSLQGGLVQANSLEDLKASVTTNLKVIEQAMRQFQQEEQQKRQQMHQEMANLDRYLQQMNDENKRVQVELENSKRQAITDSLTGLPNRLAYEQRMSLSAAESNRTLALAVGDIDRFKLINDTFGHQAGDKLLQIVGRLMSASMRSSDFLCRYGGEEFVLLLSLDHEQDAVSVLEKLRKRIANTRLHFKGQPISVTISFGLALKQPGESGEQLFNRADTAMYQAKQLGRNRIVVANLSSQAMA